MIGFSHLRISNFVKFSSLALLLVLPLSTVCLSQTITVHLVDQKNGHPLRWANQRIVLAYAHDSDELKRTPHLGNVETDAIGEAQFKLPNPPPELLQFWLMVSHVLSDCGCRSDPSRAGDVLGKGIVLWKQTSVGSFGNVKAQPGEVLILIRPMSLAKRLTILLFGWAEKE